MTETPEPTPDNIPAARVQKVGDHYLVTHGSWQVSVHPDGLMMLPRHLHPAEAEDFIRCVLVAKEIGAGVISDNEAKTPAPHAGLNGRQAIVRHGGAPAGTTRMRVTTGHERAASIGRQKRNRGGAR